MQCDLALCDVLYQLQTVNILILAPEQRLTHCAMGIVDPIRCEEPAECCHEYQAAIVLNGLGELSDFVRFFTKPEVI